MLHSQDNGRYQEWRATFWVACHSQMVWHSTRTTKRKGIKSTNLLHFLIWVGIVKYNIFRANWAISLKKKWVIAQKYNSYQSQYFCIWGVLRFTDLCKFILLLFLYLLRMKDMLIIVTHDKVPKKPQQVPKKMMICLKSFK